MNKSKGSLELEIEQKEEVTLGAEIKAKTKPSSEGSEDKSQVQSPVTHWQIPGIFSEERAIREYIKSELSYHPMAKQISGQILSCQEISSELETKTLPNIVAINLLSKDRLVITRHNSTCGSIEVSTYRISSTNCKLESSWQHPFKSDELWPKLIVKSAIVFAPNKLLIICYSKMTTLIDSSWVDLGDKSSFYFLTLDLVSSKWAISQKYPGKVTAVTALPDGLAMAIQQKNSVSVMVWDSELKQSVKKYSDDYKKNDEYTQLALLPDGRLAGASKQAIKIWNIQNPSKIKEPVVRINLTAGSFCTSLLGLNNHILAAAFSNGNIHIWDISAKIPKQIHVCLAHNLMHSESPQHRKISLAILPENRLLSSMYNEFKIWDVPHLKCDTYFYVPLPEVTTYSLDLPPVIWNSQLITDRGVYINIPTAPTYQKINFDLRFRDTLCAAEVQIEKKDQLTIRVFTATPCKEALIELQKFIHDFEFYQHNTPKIYRSSGSWSEQGMKIISDQCLEISFPMCKYTDYPDFEDGHFYNTEIFTVNQKQQESCNQLLAFITNFIYPAPPLEPQIKVITKPFNGQEILIQTLQEILKKEAVKNFQAVGKMGDDHISMKFTNISPAAVGFVAQALNTAFQACGLKSENYKLTDDQEQKMILVKLEQPAVFHRVFPLLFTIQKINLQPSSVRELSVLNSSNKPKQRSTVVEEESDKLSSCIMQ